MSIWLWLSQIAEALPANILFCWLSGWSSQKYQRTLFCPVQSESGVAVETPDLPFFWMKVACVLECWKKNMQLAEAKTFQQNQLLVRHNQMACCRQLRHTNGPLNDTPTLPTRGLILSERGLTLMPQNLIGLLEYLWFWKSLKTKNVPYQVLLHIINIAYQSVTATSVMESFPGLKVNYIHTYSIHRSSFRTEMYASSWSECCFMRNTVLGFWHSFVK